MIRPTCLHWLNSFNPLVSGLWHDGVLFDPFLCMGWFSSFYPQLSTGVYQKAFNAESRSGDGGIHILS